MHRNVLTLSAALLLAAGPALAADPPEGGEEAIDLSQIMGMVSRGMPQASASGGLPDFAKVTEGMEAKKGLFTLWSYPAGSGKDPEKLLCQIPAGFLGQNFMLSTSFSGGGFFTGFPIDERVVQWELLGDQLLLVEPESHYVIDGSAEVADVVKRTYPELIRAAVPLVTKSPSGDPVIDLGTLLKSEFADISWTAIFGGGLPGLGGINPALSTWTKKKTFDLNVEIGVALAMSRMSPPGSFNKRMVHYSFWKLPSSSYRPRVADDRVGYFLTANLDWSKPVTEDELFNRYIDRWHLVKRDPSLELCEPRQPIIFYIEKTVPVRYRRAVRDGILEWNKAFEEIGFSNAIVVRQQTDDNEWKDLDPEDMRYSFFRWIVTGAGFAMGPHRANPFTGEIYDADIIFDDSMVRYFEQEVEMLLPEAAMQAKAADPALAAFLEAHPQWKRPAREWERFAFGDRFEQVQQQEAFRARVRQRGGHMCEYADGMKHQMRFARTVLADQPRQVREEFLYDIIKEVVMHEVGHTLGLRHNFKASSIWTFEQIEERREAGEATTGSVMDYNPALLFASGSVEGHFITPTIGPYDSWAIEYGYRPFDGSYKSGKAASPSGAEDENGDKDEKAGGDEPQPASVTEAAAAPAMPQGMPDLSDPATVEKLLAQVPPEMRAHIEQMLESGAVGQMLHGMPQQSSARPIVTPAARSSGPAFKSAASGETGMLRGIASRASEPELAYATDEDTTMLGPDPRTWRFDAAQDPIAWARDRTALVDKRMAEIREWAVDDEEAWYKLTGAFVTLMFEKALVLDAVGRYVGGQYFHRHHKGDPGAEPPFVLVDPQVQRDALAFIEASLYNDEFFDVDPELLVHLAPPRWWHWNSSVSYTMDFPVHALIGVLQWWNLFDRMYPNTLRRIYDAERKTDADDKITAAEYLTRLTDGVWGGTLDGDRYAARGWTDANPYVTDIRRSLQREYLWLLEPLVRTRPGTLLPPDLHAMVRYTAVTLSEQIGDVLDNGELDFASAAHLSACKTRIDRMLEAELPEYGG